MMIYGYARVATDGQTLVAQVAGPPWRTPRPAPRRAPNARLEGRSTALCVLPDGRLASGSHDGTIRDEDNGTIRLWDVTAGAETSASASLSRE